MSAGTDIKRKTMLYLNAYVLIIFGGVISIAGFVYGIIPGMNYSEQDSSMILQTQILGFFLILTGIILIAIEYIRLNKESVADGIPFQYIGLFIYVIGYCVYFVDIFFLMAANQWYLDPSSYNRNMSDDVIQRIGLSFIALGIGLVLVSIVRIQIDKMNRVKGEDVVGKDWLSDKDDSKTSPPRP